MVYKKTDSVLKFIYSYPYETALLRLVGKKPTEITHKKGLEKAKLAQEIWDKHEAEILTLFKEIYKIKINEKFIKAFISQVAPNSFSNPLTITLKQWPVLKNNPRSQRGFVYVTIHELAHYFSYTRDKKTFFNQLFKKVQKLDILGSHGANLHYLIQAVEFGIVGEVFGRKYAEYSRDWAIKNWKNTEYASSAALLKNHRVPLNKNCLVYINKLLMKKNK